MGRAEDLFEQLARDGEAALEHFIASRKSEELYLDFKRSSDNGSGRRLSDIDRNNLAKAISGFGNSEGGVVVWGIDCSGDSDGADVARASFLLSDTARFLSWLEGAVSGRTVPPHQGVRHHAITSGSGPSGYVVTLIPQSDAAPHQVVGRMVYYIRAGSDFVPTPHAVLAGMFGRRPQPHVFHSFVTGPASFDQGTISCQLGIMIRNQGPGIATDLFVNVLVRSVPSGRCQLAFEHPDPDNWSGVFSFRRQMSLICRPEFRLPPESQAQPLLMKISLSPPFESPVDIKGLVGSGTGPPYRFHFFNSAENIASLYEQVKSGIESGADVSAHLRDFSLRLLGIPDDE